MNAPVSAVGQNNPLDAFIRCVVYRPLDVGVLQLDSDRLDLDQVAYFLIWFDRQVYVGAPDGILARDVKLFVVSADIGEHVINYGDSVGFTDVTLLRFARTP